MRNLIIKPRRLPPKNLLDIKICFLLMKSFHFIKFAWVSTPVESMREALASDINEDESRFRSIVGPALAVAFRKLGIEYADWMTRESSNDSRDSKDSIKENLLLESHLGGDGLLWYNLNTEEVAFTIPHESAWERRLIDDDQLLLSFSDDSL